MNTDTSVAAYESIEPSLSAHRAEILAQVREAGTRGLTCWEASQMTGKPQNAISGRFTELASMGLIERTKYTRPTGSGCKASVWVTAAPTFSQGELF